ncbi:LexA family transcriptional regulator [Bosea sp. TWI1241]|uniref:LexA family transcriptional regulator n=1 Tax=Bosea sp. TWI1241 TaxID=3148904 RepID=UPI00320B4495
MPTSKNRIGRDDDAEQRLLFATRLREAVGKFGGPSAASKALGVPLSTLNDYLAANTEPKMSLIARMARTLGTTIGYLFGATDRIGVGGNSDSGAEIPDDERIRLIPRLSVQVSAGLGRENVDGLVLGYVPLTEALLDKLGIKAENAHFIEAAGDSMEETIFDGDDVLIDMGDTALKAEGIYALQVGDLAMIKRVQPLAMFDTVSLLSDNPRYQPQTVKRGEQDLFRPIGRAKLVMRVL